MHEQRGTFNGIDTCNVIDHGRFDQYSILRFEAEARSIFNRPDINVLLTQLSDQKVITKDQAYNMQQ